jgi:hypothetical protein
MTYFSDAVAPDMLVVSADGEQIGQVVKVFAGSFAVLRPHGAELYVPFDAVQDVILARIILNRTAALIETSGWLQQAPMDRHANRGPAPDLGLGDL